MPRSGLSILSEPGQFRGGQVEVIDRPPERHERGWWISRPTFEEAARSIFNLHALPRGARAAHEVGWSNHDRPDFELQRLETMSSNCYAIRAVPEGKPITGPGYYPGPPPAAVSLDSVPVRTAGIAGPGYYPADTTEQRWFIEYRDDQSSRWTALDGRMPEDDFHNDLRPWPPGG